MLIFEMNSLRGIINDGLKKLSAAKGIFGFKTFFQTKICLRFEFYLNVDMTLIDMPLVGSPIPTAIIICIYLVFVTRIGPIFMKNRGPMYPRKWIMAYNAYQICANSFICYSVSVLL